MNNDDIEKLEILREQLEDIDRKINNAKDNVMPFKFARDKILEEINLIENKDTLNTFFNS